MGRKLLKWWEHHEQIHLGDYYRHLWYCIYGGVLSYVRLFAAPGTVVGQTPLSVEFFRQEYWFELPFPTPRDLPDPGLISHLLHLLHW